MIVLRCYAQRDGEVLVASCLDLGLATQGDSYREVKKKLEAQIIEYVHDALAGEDRQYADQLLNRKAPAPEWIKYYLVKAALSIHSLQTRLPRLFNEFLPMEPCRHP